jgi:hypothetical protein
VLSHTFDVIEILSTDQTLYDKPVILIFFAIKHIVARSSKNY